MMFIYIIYYLFYNHASGKYYFICSAKVFFDFPFIVFLDSAKGWHFRWLRLLEHSNALTHQFHAIYIFLPLVEKRLYYTHDFVYISQLLLSYIYIKMSTL